MKPGFVFWFTGLSGAGKTAIGKRFYEEFRERLSNVVFLDGDELREAFGNDLGHSSEDRKKSAMRNSRLCRLLSNQGIHVVIATISLFHEVQNWNRKNIPGYREIYISVPLEVLSTRDPKGIYARAKKGHAKNVYGIDLGFEAPKTPELILNNDGTQSIEIAMKIAVNRFQKELAVIRGEK